MGCNKQTCCKITFQHNIIHNSLDSVIASTTWLKQCTCWCFCCMCCCNICCIFLQKAMEEAHASLEINVSVSFWTAIVKCSVPLKTSATCFVLYSHLWHHNIDITLHEQWMAWRFRCIYYCNVSTFLVKLSKMNRHHWILVSLFHNCKHCTFVQQWTVFDAI